MVVVERESQETDKEGTMESAAASSEPSTRETGTVPRPRRFLTRSSAARRKQQEAILLAALGSMELDLVADNIPSHEALLRQLLTALEQDHLEFMIKEGLNPNAEPEKSYMLEYERKVDRAVNKHNKRLYVPVGPDSQPEGDKDPDPDMVAIRRMEEDL